MNYQKAIKKIEALKKQQKNCSFKTIQTILTAFGFQHSQPSGGSSHHKFKRKPGEIIIVPYNKPVKEHYIKEIIKILEVIADEFE